MGVFVVAVVLFTFWDRPGGAAREVTGMVQGVSYRQADGPATRLVWVKLTSGEVVVAGALPGLVITPGDTVLVRVHATLITGSPTYGVQSVVEKK